MSTATDLIQANYTTQHDSNAENAYGSTVNTAHSVDVMVAEGKRDQTSYASPSTVGTAVLRISGMPTRHRAAIERAMVQCIVTSSEYMVPGDDPLTAQWCTRWYRDTGFLDDLASLAAFPGVQLPKPRLEKCVGCRQVITGTAHELRALDTVVSTLAEEFGFSASVEQV